MSKVSVNIPKSLRRRIENAVEEEGVSMSEFIAIAAAEKVAALDTEAYLEERAKRGSREKLLRVLNKAPDVEPEEYDKL